MAEELKTVLGFDATAAIKTLAEMEKRLISWTAAMNSAATATSSFNKNAKVTEAAITKQTKNMSGYTKQSKQAGVASQQLAKNTNIITESMKKYGKVAAKIPATHPIMLKQAKAAGELAANTKKLAAVNKLAKKEQDLVNSSMKKYGAVVSKIPATHPAMLKQKEAAKKLAVAASQLKKEQNMVNSSMKRYGMIATKLPATHPIMVKQKEEALKAKKAMADLGKTTQKTGKDMILSWKSVIRIFTIQVIHQMVSKITSSLGEAVRNTIDLENRLAEIQTIGGSLKDDFEGLSNEVRILSDEFGVQAEIVAEGVYQTLSNQVAEAEKSFVFFSAAAQFSIAAVTGADSAVNLLSSTINAFGYNASQAEVIGGKLFKTIELGRIRGEEFANTFGRVAVLASNLGISLDETLAAIATLTISGLKYNEAFTLITNTMLKLIKPTEALKRVYADMGVISAEAAIQAFGFLGFLDQLADAAGGTATEIGKLFSRVRAIRGILGLTGDAAEKAAKNLEAIREAGSADLFEAKELIFKTNAKQVQIEIEELRNALLFDFGRPALGVILEVIQTFGGLVAIVRQLTIALGVAGVAGAALALYLWPVTVAYGAIALSVAATSLAVQELTKTELTGIEERLRAQKKAIHEIDIEESELAEAQIRRNHLRFSELQKYLIATLEASKDTIDNSKAAEEYISDIINDQLKDRLSSYESYVSELSDIIENSEVRIAGIQRQARDIEQEQQNALFNIRISHLDAYQKYEGALAQGRRLRFQAEEEAREGRFADADTLFNQAKTVIQIALSLDAQLGNIGGRSRAESGLRQVYQSQLEIKKEEEQIEKNRGKRAETQYAEETARLDRIRFLTKKAQDFKLYDKGKLLFPTEADAKAAIAPTIAAIKKEFMALGKGGDIFKQLDLDKYARELTKPFEDVFTRKPVSLEFLYKQRLEEVFRDIEKIGKDHPPTIKIQLEALGFDISTLKGIQDTSKGLPKVEEELTKATRSTVGFKGKQQELKDTLLTNVNILKALKTAIMNFRTETWTAGPIGGMVLEDIKPLEDAAEIFRAITSQMQRLKEETKDGIIDEALLKDVFFIMERQAEKLEEVGAVDASGGVRILIENLKRVLELQEEAILNQDQLSKRQSLEAAFNPINQAYGGMIYRQLGGFMPQGTDTVPAMLSPGEFVVNADATRKFYSQLVAINSGVKPIFRERGGPVTNVGDVNITVTETASAKATARETMTAFRRETRRHTSRSF